MKNIFIEYQKCSTCKKAKKWLQENNVEFIERNIVTDTPTIEELTKWIQESGKEIRKWFNTSGLKYKELNLKDELETKSDNEKINLLASDGMLIKRPILISDKGIFIGSEVYKRALETNQRESYKYIGDIVKVEIDRPINSKHPKHKFRYTVNYGYVPNTTSGDGEEIDCYVLGIDYPLENFEGRCIAVIHRTNDDDDKLIIVPDGMNYTDDEIRELTNFQEQYFESEIIR